MERVLAVYARPYDPKRPVLCFDERPCFLIDDVIVPVAMAAGKVAKEDYSYEKRGSCAVLFAFEPLTGKRFVTVCQRRTAKEYSSFMQQLAHSYPKAQQITLVQDNLNTHHGGSFYRHLQPEQARDLETCFEWVYTPKHASWLNMAELELSAMSRQCLDRRIGSEALLRQEVTAWVAAREAAEVVVNWQFSIQDARCKFKRHYDSVRIN